MHREDAEKYRQVQGMQSPHAIHLLKSKMSKDDYIARLEAELQFARGGTREMSSSTKVFRSDSDMRQRDYSKGTQVRIERKSICSSSMLLHTNHWKCNCNDGILYILRKQ